MKRCDTCRRTKPLDAFYRHPNMADGRLSKCKACKKKQSKATYWKAPEKRKAYEQERRHRQDHRANKARLQMAYAATVPGKIRARRAVNAAVASGQLVRLPCEKCGNPNSHGHHDDYRKPLKVRWLCDRCHKREHSSTSSLTRKPRVT